LRGKLRDEEPPQRLAGRGPAARRLHKAVGMKSCALAILGLVALATSAAAQAPAPTRPALMFKEDWKQPPYTGTLNDENRRATEDAITNPKLELKLYGA